MPIQNRMIKVSMFLISIVLISCKKFVTVDAPKTQIINNSVFSSDLTANAALNGIYSKLNGNSGFASGDNTSITALAGLSSDEFINFSSSLSTAEFANNSISPSNSLNQSSLWGQAYQFIYSGNAILEGVVNSNNLTSAVKQQLTGEAKFIRAFTYFYLVNMYGDVPLVLTTDYEKNKVIGKTSSAQIYDQIILDLKDAQNLLPNNYSASKGERVRPNAAVATALLARVYLYLGQWANAETQSTLLLSNPAYSLNSNLNNVFLKNSSEAIWQLMPNSSNINTAEGNIFILTSSPLFITLSSPLLNAFESADNRKQSWVGNFVANNQTYYFPYKYKVRTGGSPYSEYSMVFRLGEQFLIRAEARVHQNNISGGQNDLNAIRNRAGLANTTASDTASLLLAIENERQVELFAEWGHRWFDLKRTNRANSILGTIKPSTWNSAHVLFPIPQSEINNDQNLTQNTGY